MIDEMAMKPRKKPSRDPDYESSWRDLMNLYGGQKSIPNDLMAIKKPKRKPYLSDTVAVRAISLDDMKMVADVAAAEKKAKKYHDMDRYHKTVYKDKSALEWDPYKEETDLHERKRKAAEKLAENVRVSTVSWNNPMTSEVEEQCNYDLTSTTSTGVTVMTAAGVCDELKKIFRKAKIVTVNEKVVEMFLDKDPTFFDRMPILTLKEGDNYDDWYYRSLGAVDIDDDDD